MKKLSLVVLALALAGASSSASQGSGTLGPYESYYRYIGNYPHNEETPFSELMQGVSHDDDHWYITQQEYLWKIPVEIDLVNMPDSSRWAELGILRVYMQDVQPLHDAGYNHMGDLTYYYGYLVLPLECVEGPCNGKTPPPGIAVFRASDLYFLGYDEISTPDGSWIAVDPSDPEGLVYTARTWRDIRFLSKYEIDWDLLQANPPQVKVTRREDQQIFDANESDLTIQHSQGASFSESGHLLFILTGGTSSSEEECAIHVFETQEWRRIAVSSQTDPFFNYECHPGSLSDESEGVTVWDLDSGRAPGIHGQLHIIRIDVDWPSDDDLNFQHYTGSVFVNAAYTGSDADGTISRPFPSVNQASSYAWPGSKIQIQAGRYEEAVTFAEYVRIHARAGTAVVGPSGNLLLSPSGGINLSPNGVVRIP